MEMSYDANRDTDVSLEMLDSDSHFTPTYIDQFVIKTNSRTIQIDIADIDYIEACDYYVELHVGGSTHLLRESMRALEQRLDPEQFVRIHRSTMVNLKKIETVELRTHGEHSVRMKDGTVLRASRSYKAKLHNVAAS